MNRIHHWPAALLSLAAFGVAATAQEPPRPVEPTAKPATGADKREDVEILRRLLDNSLGEAYGLSGRKLGERFAVTSINNNGGLTGRIYLNERNFDSMESPHQIGPRTEGVYLKDYGVVYTATLPYPGFDPVSGSKPGAETKPPIDPWDRTRKEIRGETPEPEGKAVPAHQPLSNVILKVLAENGRHFTALADGERITVAVTFRGAANCANCHQSATWQNLPPGYYPYQTTYNPYQTAQGPPGGMPPGSSSPPRMTPPGGVSFPPPGSQPPDGGAGAPLRTAQEAPEWLTDVRNQILLGDLHMKQGKGQEAVSAYTNALNKAEMAIDHKRVAKEGYAPSDLPLLLTAGELCNKLAQANVAAGNDEEARGMLSKAGILAKAAEKLTGAAATANPQPAGAAALPAKLVVTASKKLLDDVGHGKMTFEAFCKEATVEYTRDAGGNTPQAVQTAPGAGGR